MSWVKTLLAWVAVKIASTKARFFAILSIVLKIGGEIRFQIPPFAAVARTEPLGDNISVLVEHGDANFVKDELLVVILGAVDDFGGRPEVENAGKNLRTAFEQGRLDGVR